MGEKLILEILLPSPIAIEGVGADSTKIFVIEFSIFARAFKLKFWMQLKHLHRSLKEFLANFEKSDDSYIWNQ